MNAAFRLLRRNVVPITSLRLRRPLSKSSSQSQWACCAAAATVASGLWVGNKCTRLEVEKKPKTKHLVLAADCGGTNTRLMLYKVDPSEPILEKQPPPGRLLKEVKYPNTLFKSLDDIITIFLEDECGCGQELDFPVVAVLAVAGIVANNTVRYTNLDWVVSGFELEEKLKIARVEIINDFVAQGYGALTLSSREVIRLNDVEPQAGAPMACIGAGTGLGECFLVADSSGEYRCYPSEGGHVEFAPRGQGNDDLHMKLLQHLKVKFSGWNRVSVERVVSGKGICNVYEFLAFNSPLEVDPVVHKAFVNDHENAGIIAANAKPGTLCEKAMKIFANCYGSQAGSLALHFMPYKGLYITGGVTQKNLGFLQRDSTFMDAYLDKGRVSPLLNRVPLYFVKGEDMGQRGAHYRAVSLLKQVLEGRASRIEKAEKFSVTDLPPPRSVFQEVSAAQKAKAELEDFTKQLKELPGRRVPTSGGPGSEKVYEGSLKKVLKVGSRHKSEDWNNSRSMYLSKDGSLSFYSEEEERDLVYWNKDDFRNATVAAVPNDDSAMPYTFKVHPVVETGDNICPTYFAANSDKERSAWIANIQESQKLHA